MNQEDFKFLVMRDPDNGLVFVALDSIVGYIRHLSDEVKESASFYDDSIGADVISRAFSLLAEKFEEMEEINGRGRITDI